MGAPPSLESCTNPSPACEHLIVWNQDFLRIQNSGHQQTLQEIILSRILQLLEGTIRMDIFLKTLRQNNFEAFWSDEDRIP